MQDADKAAIIWEDDGRCLKAKFHNLLLTIERLPISAPPITGDRKVVSLRSRRFRALVDGVIVNPATPYHLSLDQAKHETEALAHVVWDKILRKRLILKNKQGCNTVLPNE